MYKLLIKSALASLVIRKSRTLLVISMIAISLWGLIFMQGIYDGMIKQMIDNAIRSDSGELSIFLKDFRTQKEVWQDIKNYKDIENILNNDKNVKSYTKRVLSSGLIATARYSKNASIYGIDLEEEKKQAKLNEYIKDGEFSFGDKENGVILGLKLAQKLKIKLGNKVVLMAQDTKGEVSSISLKIKGIIKTNNMSFDENGVFIDINKAKKILALNGVNQISILTYDYSKSKMLKDKLTNKFQNLEIFTWEELYPALIQSKEYMIVFNYISYFIVFFIATIGIFGVVLVSVLERIREFGILRAIGTSFSQIITLIFLEGFFIGLIGFIVGCLLSFSTLYYFKIYGLDLSSFSDALDEFGMDAITYAVIKSEYFITGFISVVIAILSSIIIPLRILKKSKIVRVINE